MPQTNAQRKAMFAKLSRKDIVHIDNSLQDAQIMVDRLPQNSTSRLAIQKIKQARRKLNRGN